MISIQLFRSGPDACLWIYHRWGFGALYRERRLVEVRCYAPEDLAVSEAVLRLLRLAVAELEAGNVDLGVAD